MKKTWLSIAALPLVAAPLLWAQENGTPAPDAQTKAPGAPAETKKSGLSRVQPGERADEPVAFDVETWKTKLAHGDLEQRERDFERLVELARRHGEARDALESWTKDASRPELAWTSRLALRELERSPRRLSLAPGGGSPGWLDLHSQFEDLQRHFGDVDSRFSELQAELEQLFQNGAGFAPHGGSGHGSGRSQAQSFTLEVGPDGVTCKVTEAVDGEQKTREYSAGTLEELLEAHPELRDKIGQGTARSWNGPGEGGGLFRTRPGTRFGQPSSGAPRTDLLGVEVTKPSAERSEALDCAVGIGLHVERTVPGTIAEILGIRRGDVLVEINGAPIHDRGDIAAALRQRLQDEPLAVVLIDGKGQRRTLTWNPAKRSSARDDQDDASGASRNF